jgi:hypothetical protein
MTYDALTREQFELLAKMTSAMAAFADHILPDVVQFASRTELNELEKNIHNLHAWVDCMEVFLEK